MKEINPDNKCSNLKLVGNIDDKNKLEIIWDIQKKLQKRYNLNPDDMSFKERINLIQRHWRDICIEFGELMLRLPFKEWKKYDKRTLNGYIDKEHELEVKYEYIDMLHFFINIGLCLEIDAKELYQLYITKNKENFNRQERGY